MNNPIADIQPQSSLEHETEIEWLYPRELFPRLRFRWELFAERRKVVTNWKDRRLLVAVSRLDRDAPGLGHRHYRTAEGFLRTRETGFYRRAFFLLPEDIATIIPHLQASLAGYRPGCRPDGWPNSRPVNYFDQPDGFKDDWGLNRSMDWADFWPGGLYRGDVARHHAHLQGPRYELMAPTYHAELLKILLEYQGKHQKKRVDARQRQCDSRADRARRLSSPNVTKTK